MRSTSKIQAPRQLRKPAPGPCGLSPFTQKATLLDRATLQRQSDERTLAHATVASLQVPSEDGCRLPTRSRHARRRDWGYQRVDSHAQFSSRLIPGADLGGRQPQKDRVSFLRDLDVSVLGPRRAAKHVDEDLVLRAQRVLRPHRLEDHRARLVGGKAKREGWSALHASNRRRSGGERNGPLSAERMTQPGVSRSIQIATHHFLRVSRLA